MLRNTQYIIGQVVYVGPESKIQMKRAGEDREIENKDFQLIVADQRATIKLMTGALHALKSYFGLLQTQGINVRVEHRA